VGDLDLRLNRPGPSTPSLTGLKMGLVHDDTGHVPPSMPRAERQSTLPDWSFDAAAVLLALAGAAVLVTTLDPDWSLVNLLALALVPLGSPRLGPRVLVLAVAAAGWLAGLGRAVVETSSWTTSDYVAWGRALAVLVLAGLVALVVHGRIDRSQRRVDQALAFAQDATVHDPLTGLANRKGLSMLGAQILETARRRGDAVYCMFLDVDGLARINTDLGHGAGDDILLTVAEALSRSTRATDAVARWGDDEFVVVGPGTGLAPLEMERRVRARCLESSPVPREKWAARISAGGAVLEPWDDGDVGSLLHQADREMQLRRALRREAAAPAYRPVRLDPSPNPPDPRRPAGWGD
jgi:diguanylate cyclase (GGDEF)-like protein